MPSGYGTIAFGAADAEVPYAVVPDVITEPKLLRLIMDAWAVRRPSLILSFIGAEEGDILDLSGPVDAALTGGLSHVAQQADAWLVSGGFDHGASGLVGRAMAAADGAVKAASLAIAPLPLVKHHERFLADAAMLDVERQYRPERLNKCTLEAVYDADGHGVGVRFHDPLPPPDDDCAPCGEGGPYVSCEQIVTALEHSSVSTAKQSGAALRRAHEDAVAAAPGGSGIDVAAILLAFDRGSVRELKQSVVDAINADRAARRRVQYAKHDPNGPKRPQVSAKGEIGYEPSGYALDSRHSHYLLVDTPGGEAQARHASTRAGSSPADTVRTALEGAVRAKDGADEVPLVGVCIGGGERAAGVLTRLLQDGCVVLIVACSGGLAARLGSLVGAWRAALREGKSLDDKRVATLMGAPAAAHTASRALASLVEEVLRREDDAARRTPGGDTASDADIRPPPSLLHVYADAHLPFERAVFDTLVASHAQRRAREAARQSRMITRAATLSPMGAKPMPTHKHALRRSPLHKRAKAIVPADKVSWTVAHDAYKPVVFEHPDLIRLAEKASVPGSVPKKYADPADVKKAIPPTERGNRMSFELRGVLDGKGAGGEAHRAFERQKLEVWKATAASEDVPSSALGGLLYDADAKSPSHGCPLNPRGRTGMRGRGVLGMWGPNHAADPVVTRWDPRYPEGMRLEVVAVQRKDTGEWALPGGLVDAGEPPNLSMLRETREGAGAFSGAERDRMDRLVKLLFENGTTLYRGYVDDPRNTDNAWVETTAVHFHCSRDLAARISLAPGDDATSVSWLHIDPESEPRFACMHAAHREIVYLAHARQHVHTYARLNPLRHIRYPHRLMVPDGSVSWAAEYTPYSPEDYTDPRVIELSRHAHQSGGGAAGVLADPHCTTSDAFRSARHSSEPSRSFVDELKRERYSYEGEIAFHPTSHRPLNPRGRTGLQGRGLLRRWGVNEAADVVVTRRHPRDDRLQVACVLRDDGSWAIPGDMISVGVDPRRTARALFDEKLLRGRRTLDCTSRAMLDEGVTALFEAAEQHVVYRGYVDDPRNTDNAWVETTAYHLHCARELGGLLPLAPEIDEEIEPRVGRTSGASMLVERVGKDDSLDGDDAFVCVGRARWLTIGADDERYAKLYANHRELIERVARQIERGARRVDLLETVVAWGEKQWVDAVLDAPALIEERAPVCLQKALHAAMLNGAARTPGFDPSIAQLLVERGARYGDVYWSGLIAGAAGRADAFGLMRTAALGAPKPAATPTRALTRWLPCFNGTSGRRKGGTTAARAPLAFGGLMERHAIHLEHPMRRDVRTPFRAEHLVLMAEALPGFSAYHHARAGPSGLELMTWAVLCGASDLARQVWNTSEAPLRAALLTQRICAIVATRHAQTTGDEAAVRSLQRTLSQLTSGVLDELSDREQARRLLLSTCGPFATLGTARGLERLSTIDLAVSLQNQPFVRHPYVVGIVDEMWMGRSAGGGPVRLAHLEPLWRLWLQLPLTLIGVRIVALEVNDLYPQPPPDYWPSSSRGLVQRLLGGRSVFRGRHPAEHTTSVSAADAWVGFYHIPLVKRALSLLTRLAYALLVLVVFSRRPCGPADAMHYVLCAWTASLLLGEWYMFRADRSHYARDQWNRLDRLAPICIALAITCRLFIIDDEGYGLLSRAAAMRYPNATSLTDLASLALPAWGLRRFERAVDVAPMAAPLLAEVRSDAPLHPDTAFGNGYFAADECLWSVEHEFARTFGALGLALSIARLLEAGTLGKRSGSLLLCLGRLANELTLWLRPALTLTAAFALGLVVLAPGYHLSGTRGPITPIPFLALDVSVGGPLWAPLWALVGYIEPSDLDALPAGAPTGASFLTPLWLWVYMLMMLLLLANALIAMLVSAHAAAGEWSDAQWQLSRLIHLRRHALLPAVPSPVYLMWRIVGAVLAAARWIIGTKQADKKPADGAKDVGDDDDDDDGGVGRRTSKVGDVTAVGKVVDGPGRWHVQTVRGMEEHQMADRTLYSFRYSQQIESGARARLLRRLAREHAGSSDAAHVAAVTRLEQRMVCLQGEMTSERANLTKTLVEMRKQSLLSALPIFAKEVTNAAQFATDAIPGEEGQRVHVSKVQSDVHLGFADALRLAVAPLVEKVEGVEAQLRVLKEKVDLSAASPKPLDPNVGSAPSKKKTSQPKVSYMQQAHAAGTPAYRMPNVPGDDGPGPLPAPHRDPPSAPHKGKGVSLPPMASGAQLPPPPASDAGPDPYPDGVTASFTRFDTDASGTIDARELRSALTALGLATTAEQAQLLLAKYDADHSGQLELPEFADLVAELKRFQSSAAGGAAAAAAPPRAAAAIAPITCLPPGSSAAQDETRRVFALYDADASGDIDVAELRAALEALGLGQTTTDQASAIMARYDAGGSSRRLEFGEFSRLVNELRRFQAGRPR